MSIQMGKPLALTRENNLRGSLFVSATQDAWTIPLWGCPEHPFWPSQMRSGVVANSASWITTLKSTIRNKTSLNLESGSVAPAMAWHSTPDDVVGMKISGVLGKVC
jgi:hypothetical protein